MSEESTKKTLLSIFSGGFVLLVIVEATAAATVLPSFDACRELEQQVYSSVFVATVLLFSSTTKSG